MNDTTKKPDDPSHQPLHMKQYNSFESFYRELPIEGSLGILAYGASGILAWKKKRLEAGWVPPEPVLKKPQGKKKKDEEQENG